MGAIALANGGERPFGGVGAPPAPTGAIPGLERGCDRLAAGGGGGGGGKRGGGVVGGGGGGWGGSRGGKGGGGFGGGGFCGVLCGRLGGRGGGVPPPPATPVRSNRSPMKGDTGDILGLPRALRLLARRQEATQRST